MNKTTNVTKLLKRLVETKAEKVKLGMDVHARDVVVGCNSTGRDRSARKK